MVDTDGATLAQKINCKIFPGSYFEVLADLLSAFIMREMEISIRDVKEAVTPRHHGDLFDVTWAGDHPKGVDRERYVGQLVDAMGTELTYENLKSKGLMVAKGHTLKVERDCDAEEGLTEANRRKCKEGIALTDASKTYEDCLEEKRVLEKKDAARRAFFNRILALIVEAFGVNERTFDFYRHYMPRGEQTRLTRENAYMDVAKELYLEAFTAWKHRKPGEFLTDDDADDVTEGKRREILTWLESPERDWRGKLAARWRACLASATELDTAPKKEFCCRSFPAKAALEHFHVEQCERDYHDYEANENRFQEQLRERLLRAQHAKVENREFLKGKLAERRKQFEDPEESEE